MQLSSKLSVADRKAPAVNSPVFTMDAGPPRPLGRALPLTSVCSGSSSSTSAARHSAVQPSPLLLAMSSVPAWSSRQTCPSTQPAEDRRRLESLVGGHSRLDRHGVSDTHHSASLRTGQTSQRETLVLGPAGGCSSSAGLPSQLSSMAAMMDDNCPIPRPKPELGLPTGEEPEFSGQGVSERGGGGPNEIADNSSVLHVHYHIGSDKVDCREKQELFTRVFDSPNRKTTPPETSWRECTRLEYWKQVFCCSPAASTTASIGNDGSLHSGEDNF